MSIEEAVEAAVAAVNEQVEEAIGNLDMSVEIAQECEHVIDNYDFSYVIYNNIDHDDIRYHIEDDILGQVNDYVDIQSAVMSFIFEGCGVMDRAANKIVERSMGGDNDWFIPTVEQWVNRNSDEGPNNPHVIEEDIGDLQAKVTGLEATVARLLEVISLPEVKTPQQALVDAINSGEMGTIEAMDLASDIRAERFQTIRYMSKPELVAWATENGYDVEGMTVAAIHGLVL